MTARTHSRTVLLSMSTTLPVLNLSVRLRLTRRARPPNTAAGSARRERRLRALSEARWRHEHPVP